MLTERSRLGDESLDDGLDDRDKDDLGLEGRPAESSGERNTIGKVTRSFSLESYIFCSRRI